MLSQFKVKALLMDPALGVAVIPILTALLPGASTWWQHHAVLIGPLVVVLLGHFGVRLGGVLAAGNAASAQAGLLSVLCPSNPAPGEPAQAEAVVPEPVAPVVAVPAPAAPVGGPTNG